jgi:hypothetical protein
VPIEFTWNQGVWFFWKVKEFDFPIQVRSRDHLCYISLPFILRKKVLGLSKLYQLQFLIASEFYTTYITLKKLKEVLGPEELKGIGKLGCLRYVSFFNCYFCVGRLTCLQELQNFHVGPRKSYDISSLKRPKLPSQAGPAVHYVIILWQ